MSQNDFTIANQTFPNTRADINSALQALASTSSGSSAPSTTFANQFFYNTTSNLLQIRNEDNDAFVTIANIDQTNDRLHYLQADNIRTALIEFTDGDDALAIADGGALTVSTSLDMNGTELFLDADADTSITADADDTIHFKIAGTDHIQFDANGITVSDADNSQPRIILKTTDAGTGSPFLDFIKDSASPADNDNLMVLRNIGDNSAGETIAYTTMLGQSTDVTDGTEDGRLAFQAFKDGANADRLVISGNAITIPAGNTITNSGTATGFGKILQVVNATVTSVTSTTGTAYVTSNVAAQITPRATSSKIIVMVSASVYISGANQQASVTVFRDSTNLGNSQRGIVQFWDTGDLFQGNASMSLTDSPSSTSAVTYALYFRKLSSGGDAVFIGVDSTTNYITLLEVEG